MLAFLFIRQITYIQVEVLQMYVVKSKTIMFWKLFIKV